MPHEENGDSPSLVVADSHTLLAEAVANAAARAGYGHVEVARNVTDVYRLLASGWKPSIVLIDIDLISANEFEALEELDTRAPGVPIVVMLRDVDIENGPLMIQAFVKGALGLVSKDQGVESLMRVLDVVRHGEAAIPRAMARQVVDALRVGPALIGRAASLSPRQKQVLELVARGMTDRQIAAYLKIGLPTVRSHLEVIFEKTRTANRTAAARWAGLHTAHHDPAG